MKKLVILSILMNTAVLASSNNLRAGYEGLRGVTCRTRIVAGHEQEIAEIGIHYDYFIRDTQADRQEDPVIEALFLYSYQRRIVVNYSHIPVILLHRSEAVTRIADDISERITRIGQECAEAQAREIVAFLGRSAAQYRALINEDLSPVHDSERAMAELRRLEKEFMQQIWESISPHLGPDLFKRACEGIRRIG